MTPNEILAATRTVLLIDWPTREVPDSLARAGFSVVAHNGPGPDEHYTYDVAGDDVIERRVGPRPERVDLVYSHRPVDELPGIVAEAQKLGAVAVWCQTGSPESRRIVEAAGLGYADSSIVDAARAHGRG